MYSPDIIDRRLHQAKKAGIKFQRLPRDKSIEIAGRLEKLRYNANNELLPNGQLQRPLDSGENDFIESERVICKADFEYYLSRYHAVDRDGGVCEDVGIGAAKPLESQRKLIRDIGRREEEVHAEYAKYQHTEGIRVLAHKCRQVVFTATSRAMTLHRMLFWGARCYAAALNADGVGELYKRDKITLDHLPFWLHPGELYPDVKDQEIGFKPPLDSRLMYQAENQKSGIGAGTQQDVSHLTEVALWAYPNQIDLYFAPALPKTRMTLHIQESTSVGKGYWYDVTEACRKKLKGYESWTYVFVPWYFNSFKWRANAPDNWVPEEHTLAHAQLIERTSPEYCDGKTVHPSRNQLYWWETERARQARNGKLGYFLANYPATPEQSFTNFSEGALPAELIERMELEIREPYVYEVETEHTPSDTAVVGELNEQGFPTALFVGGSSIKLYEREDWREIERDPRGLLLMWDPPRKGRKYCMSCDPTVGRTGWNRATRFDGDHKIDNGVIEIFAIDAIKEPLYREQDGNRVLDIDPVTRQQRYLYRDLQVAEFAAPCDAVEIARIANVLGRIYAGEEDDQCLFIYESHPGPGMMTTQELLRLGYGNLWMWETFADGAAESTRAIGWHSTPRSQQILWYRAQRHLVGRKAIVRSKFLLEEYANAEIDQDKMRAKAAYGSHDDRMQAASQGFWAGHEWTQDVERVDEPVTMVLVSDYQRIAPTLDEHSSYAEWRENSTADWD